MATKKPKVKVSKTYTHAHTAVRVCINPGGWVYLEDAGPYIDENNRPVIAVVADDGTKNIPTAKEAIEALIAQLEEAKAAL